MSIDWHLIGQPRFDRIVEALLVRIYRFNSTVDPIDGRGGDGGRDIVTTQGNRVRIFQLKYFPEGFSGGFRTRKGQIHSSFKDAMAWKPYEWILVTPSNLTPQERTYVLSQQTAEYTPPKMRVWGRAELDERLAAHPDLERSFLREDHGLSEMAAIYNQERAIMADPGTDLPARIKGLGELVDSLNPYWTKDFAYQDGQITSVLRAKRTDSAKVAPIVLSMDLDLNAAPPATLSALRDNLNYGLDTKVRIPGAAVRRFAIDGPQFLREETSAVDVELSVIGSTIVPGTPVEARFVDDEGDCVESFNGQIEIGNEGAAGYGLRSRFGGHSTLTFRLPKVWTEAVEMTLAFDVKGSSVFDTLEAVRMSRLFYGSSAHLEFFIDDMRLCKFEGRTGVSAKHPLPEGFWHLEQLVTDLDVLERHSRQSFRVPESMTNLELAKVRAAALLLEGKYVVHPQSSQLTMNIDGRADQRLRDLLNAPASAIFVDMPRMAIDVAGRRITLGTVRLYHPEVEVVGAANLLRHLDEDTAKGAELKLRPRYGQHFYALMPGRFPPTDGQPELTRWNIDGFKEPGLAHGELATPSISPTVEGTQATGVLYRSLLPR